MPKYPKPHYCWFFHDWLVTSTQLVKMAGVHDYLVTVRWCATCGKWQETRTKASLVYEALPEMEA